MALSAAVLLAGALAYTSFSASTEAKTPEPAAGQLAAARADLPARPARSSRLQPARRTRRTSGYATATGTESVPVTLRRPLPDPFRAGREVVVDVRKQGAVYVGQKGSLVTKCPSKFTAAQPKT